MQQADVCILLPGLSAGPYAELLPQRRPLRVLWLLHGATCTYEDFLYRDHVAQMIHGEDVMVVMPNGLNSDYANHMEFAGGYPYTDFFFDELMPYVYGHFPASTRRGDNYLAGYSMGGAGALMLGLLRPERFGHVAVLGSSVRESAFLQPYLDWTGDRFRKTALADPRAFPTEFGDPEQGITRKEANMIGRYDTVRDYVDSPECTLERFADAAKNGRVPNLLFCCGEMDGCCEKVKKFRDYAESLGVEKIQYEFIPGYGHDRSDVAIRRALELLGL